MTSLADFCSELEWWVACVCMRVCVCVLSNTSLMSRAVCERPCTVLSFGIDPQAFNIYCSIHVGSKVSGCPLVSKQLTNREPGKQQNNASPLLSASPLLKVRLRITATVRNDPDSQFLPHYRWAHFTSHIRIIPRQQWVVIEQGQGNPGSVGVEGGDGGWCSRKRKYWKVLKYLLLDFSDRSYHLLTGLFHCKEPWQLAGEIRSFAFAHNWMHR